jgi:hypothetical protein
MNVVDPRLLNHMSVVDPRLVNHMSVVDPRLVNHMSVVDPRLVNHMSVVDPRLLNHMSVLQAEEREKAADEKIKAGAIECELRLNALQEQLRGAHDNVSDAYAMMAKAQAECVSNVEAARAAEREARKEAKEQVWDLSAIHLQMRILGLTRLGASLG